MVRPVFKTKKSRHGGPGQARQASIRQVCAIRTTPYIIPAFRTTTATLCRAVLQRMLLVSCPRCDTSTVHVAGGVPSAPQGMFVYQVTTLSIGYRKGAFMCRPMFRVGQQGFEPTDETMSCMSPEHNPCVSSACTVCVQGMPHAPCVSSICRMHRVCPVYAACTVCVQGMRHAA